MDRDKKLILLQQQIDRWIANEREQKYILMNAMDIATLFLTIGLDFDFAMIPPNDKTSILLDELKKHGFISKDTKLEHFRILFGIPLHKKNTPFEPIKWQKNKQLLRYFIYSIFTKETIWNSRYSIINLFADKHGERIRIPESDRNRLEQSKDYYYSLLYIHFILFPLLCQSLDKECKPYLKITGQIRRSLAPTAGKSKPL